MTSRPSCWCRNHESAAMLLLQTSPVRVEPLSYVRLSSDVTGWVFVPTPTTIQYSKNSKCTELKRSGWPNRVWWTNPNPHSWIFTSVSANSSSPSHLFTSATVRIPVHIAPKCGTEHIRDRWRAASLRYRNRAEIAVLMCQLVVDPYLQITGGGGGGRDPDPEIRGGGWTVSINNFFGPSGLSLV